MVRIQPGSKTKVLLMFQNKTIHISQPRALGDFKRTWRKSKTTSVASSDEVSRIPARLRRGVCQMIIVDGFDDEERILIRDPWASTKYKMDIEEFLNYWTLFAVYRAG